MSFLCRNRQIYQPEPSITNASLYQLSYAGSCFSVPEYSDSCARESTKTTANRQTCGEFVANPVEHLSPLAFHGPGALSV